MAGDKLPLVSIVTPSYNQGAYIEDNLLSVRNQDYPHVEHIVVDGGSTDDTIGILKKYESEYNLYWTSEPDRGQSDAINKGFARARGEVIGWINSDDVYLYRQVVSYVVNKFRELSDIDVLYGDGVTIDENNLVLRVNHVTPYLGYRRLLRSNPLCQPSCFFRRKVIEKHQLDIDMDLAMDYEYYLRLTRDGMGFKHVNRLLSGFRSYRLAKSRARSPEQVAEDKRIQERYGYETSLANSLHSLLDQAFFAFSKIYGVKTIITLYVNPGKYDFAFSARFDSPFKAVLRQVMPAKFSH